MGYFVETTNIDLIIPKENLDKAYRAMCELNKDDLKERGRPLRDLERTEDISSSTSVSTNPNEWSFRMPLNYDEIYTNASEIFSALGFEVVEDKNEDLSLLSYKNRPNSQEYLFLESVAPYVKPGSYIVWWGEGDYLFSYEFDGKTMKLKEGNNIWESSS